MAYEYVRTYYKVPAEYGRLVTVDGKPGIIVKDCGSQIGVLFDEVKNPANYSYCHPTWRVEYGEIGKPRRMTRSQQRYQDFLDADCFENFREYLRYLSWKKKHPEAA